MLKHLEELVKKHEQAEFSGGPNFKPAFTGLP